MCTNKKCPLVAVRPCATVLLLEDIVKVLKELEKIVLPVDHVPRAGGVVVYYLALHVTLCVLPPPHIYYIWPIAVGAVKAIVFGVGQRHTAWKVSGELLL